MTANYISWHIGMHQYEQLKRKAALEMGGQYAKLFDAFSLRDRFVSLSGHIMRMAYQDRLQNASLYMLLERFT